jgi:hypothetical protein
VAIGQLPTAGRRFQVGVFPLAALFRVFTVRPEGLEPPTF